MEHVVQELIEQKISIATMESCTGGAVANAITNVEGASSILEFSAVTYSNEFKMKMGISHATIRDYTVYSKEVAREMAKRISHFSHSRLGVGVTGRLNCEDENNPGGDTNMVYIAVYDSIEDAYYESSLKAIQANRSQNKEMIVQHVAKMLMDFISDQLSK